MTDVAIPTTEDRLVALEAARDEYVPRIQALEDVVAGFGEQLILLAESTEDMEERWQRFTGVVIPGVQALLETLVAPRSSRTDG